MNISSDIALSLVDDSFIFCAQKPESKPLKLPAYVAVQSGTNRVLACGEEAQAMRDREPENIGVINVMKEGGLADIELASSLFRYGAKKLLPSSSLLRPRIIIALRSSNPIKPPVKDMALAGGARDVFLIEMGMATAIGMQLDVEKPEIKAVLSISNDWFEFSIISLAGNLVNVNGNIGLNSFVEDIRNHITLVQKFRPDATSLETQLIKKGFTGSGVENIRGWEAWAGKTQTGRMTSRSLSEEDFSIGILPSLIRLTERIKEAILTLSNDQQYMLDQTTIHGSGAAIQIPGLADAISQQIGYSVAPFPSEFHPSIEGTRQVLKEIKFLKAMSKGMK